MKTSIGLKLEADFFFLISIYKTTGWKNSEANILFFSTAEIDGPRQAGVQWMVHRQKTNPNFIIVHTSLSKFTIKWVLIFEYLHKGGHKALMRSDNNKNKKNKKPMKKIYNVR